MVDTNGPDLHPYSSMPRHCQASAWSASFNSAWSGTMQIQARQVHACTDARTSTHALAVLFESRCSAYEQKQYRNHTSPTSPLPPQTNELVNPLAQRTSQRVIVIIQLVLRAGSVRASAIHNGPSLSRHVHEPSHLLMSALSIHSYTLDSRRSGRDEVSCELPDCPSLRVVNTAPCCMYLHCGPTRPASTVCRAERPRYHDG